MTSQLTQAVALVVPTQCTGQRTRSISDQRPSFRTQVVALVATKGRHVGRRVLPLSYQTKGRHVGRRVLPLSYLRNASGNIYTVYLFIE